MIVNDVLILQPLLSLIGIGLIALTVVATYGLCSVIGLRFSPMHNIIPFLFLGNVRPHGIRTAKQNVNLL